MLFPILIYLFLNFINRFPNLNMRKKIMTWWALEFFFSQSYAGLWMMKLDLTIFDTTHEPDANTTWKNWILFCIIRFES